MTVAERKKRGPKPKRSATVDLTIPPSANGLWFNAPGKGRVKTAEYQRWLTAAGWELKAARIATLPGWVAVLACVSIPQRWRDLDNVAKPLLDLLVTHGLIEDDKLVADLQLRWDPAVADGRILVTIRQTTSPQARTGSEGRQRSRAAVRRYWATKRKAKPIADVEGAPQ